MAAQKPDEQRLRGQKTTQSVARTAPKNKSRSWFWLALGLSGVAMISATAGALLAVSLSTKPLQQHKLTAEEAAVFDSDSISSSSMRLPELTRPVNILILGMSVLASDVDNAPPESKNLSYQPQVDSLEGLSDTMLLVRFSPETKKTVVLSIPRDTRVAMDRYGIQKINIANVYGGPALSAKTVSSLLGDIPIDRYVRINVLGVGKLIDALGGLTIYVPKDMKYKDDTQHLYVDLKEGKHRLTGDQVMQLLRFRQDRLGDIGRIQRQQMVIGALREQALNPTTLARTPKLLSVLQSHIDTNLSVEELMALLGFVSKTERSNMQMLLLPGDYNGDGRHKEVSYWLPSRRRIRALMAQYFDQDGNIADRQQLEPARMRIALQDSTGNSEAVKNLVKELNKSGYSNIIIAERWREPLSRTRIVAEQGDFISAKTVRQSLGLGEVRVETTGNLGSDITIQVGRDWVQKQAPADNFITP